MSSEKLDSLHKGLLLESNNISCLARNAMLNIDQNGFHYGSDKGAVKMHPRVSLTLTDPRQRSLNIPGRISNIYQLIAETFWVVSGGEDVDNYLSVFLPRALDFSDDGKTWRGAYGGRIFSGEYPAIQQVADLIANSPMTRQAWLPIFDPSLDLPKSLKDVYDLDFSKDIPCNVGMNFWVSPFDNKLNVDVIQRSGDIFWGTGSINLFEFSFIHELVLNHINKKLKESGKASSCLGLGSYCQRVTNLHYYPNNSNIADQLEDIKRKPIVIDSDFPMDTGTVEENTLSAYRGAAQCIVALVEVIKEGGMPKDELLEMCESWFCVPQNDTFLLYAAVTLQYTLKKFLGDECPNLLNKGMFVNHQALLASIMASKYTKFTITE